MALRTRLGVWVLSAAFAALTSIEALQRYFTFHNRTFDLALYARQAWGLAHGDFWDPIAGINFFGTHVALVLWPLGLLGRSFGTVPVLLFAQSLALGLCALPIADIAARRFGERGAIVGALAFLLYPNLGHVATYEFHPGTLGLLPLALALEAIDRRHAWSLFICALAFMTCRADFALMAVLLGGLAFFSGAELRRAGVAVSCIAVMYLLVQFLVLKRLYWSTHTSFDLHFAPWGGSPFGIVRALFQKPAVVLGHLLAPERLSYPVRVLLPLLFLPLLAPRWLVVALPIFAINLVSTFATTTELYSHYLTPAVPVLVVAALDGLPRLCAWAKRHMAAPQPVLLQLMAASALGASWFTGGLPWSRDFEHAAFHSDAFSAQAARVLAELPAHASVQAPDALLAHLIERHALHRAPPPDQNADYVVLDVSHRQRYAHREDLLRTLEEPVVRNWLARRDYGVVDSEPELLLLQRGADPRSGLARRYLADFPGRRSARLLTRCLLLLSAWLTEDGLELELFSHAPCPSDLALRLGAGDKPARVDLLFDGLLSPANLRDEYLTSWHELSKAERAAILAHGLHVGALRSSGAPPEQTDPISIAVPLIH